MRGVGAWGPDATQWDDSGDYAAILHRDGRLREPSYDLLTWWHDDQPLLETARFCLDLARQADETISEFLIVEFGVQFGETEVLEVFRTASRA